MHFRIPADTDMTPEVLAKYITKHKEIVLSKLDRLDKAYKCDYPIFHEDRKPNGKPDNRMAANFAKYLVDTFEGFFCGIPIKTSSDDSKVDDFLHQFDAYNDQDNKNSELSKLCSNFGSGHEMYYVDEESNLSDIYLSPMNSFFLVDESILERPLYFIHYYKDSNDVERGTWSDAAVVQHFHFNGSYKWDGEPKAHGFDDVPATEYIENEEQLGVFESVLSLIDGYNKTLSGEANDAEYFSDAYMKVLGKKLSSDDITNIRDNRVINLWSEDPDEASGLDADFMQRPSGDTSSEHFLDRAERLIFVLSMIPNINDDNFGTSSGIALRYKLQSMSNMAMTKERKFRSGMSRRYKILFSNPVVMNQVSPDDWTKVNVKFTRNYPANISDEADTAAKLQDIVSQETQLGVLSIVDDPKSEIERINKEKADQLDVYKKADTTGGGNTTRQASTYEITSILSQRAKGQITFNNAVRMLQRLGFGEETAKAMLNDKDAPTE